MSKDLRNIALKLLAIGAAACSSVYAARSAPEIAVQPGAPPDAPLAPSRYSIELVDEAGRTLETYQKGNRFYVLGAAGTRYAVRVTNPTDRRVEAVLSIDGLDVIDGDDADFSRKRGYIVPARDVLVVDGFRTSQSAVAAFRFSSVGESYAERKGKGRNVGVVGVAIFEEKADATLVVPEAQRVPVSDDPVDRWLDRDHRVAPQGGQRGRDEARTGGDDRSIEAPPSTTTGRFAGNDKAGSAEQAPSGPRMRRPAEPVGDVPAASPPPHGGGGYVDQGGLLDRRPIDEEVMAKKSNRPGLGTAWGEQRYSAVSFTRFVRSNPTRPDALAELRYNDHDGLVALGILLRPMVDPGELATRETADPFPATRFAQPPQ